MSLATVDAFIHKREKCKDCDIELKTKYDDDKISDTLTITTYCPNCSYESVDVTDFKKSREERKLKEERDKQLLQKYRKEFCLDDTNGPQYLDSIDSMRRLVDSWREQEKKESDPVYQKAQKLKKLTLNQLKEALVKSVESNGYIDLEFGKPDMGKYVTIEFTINDTINDRGEYDSRSKLKKLMNKTLIDTNWRLMNEGISYRLGILTGRLKAYENEVDLMKLVK